METSKEINIRVLDRALDVLECFSEDTRELNLMDVVEKTGPVSYTHLDVYKRQTHGRPGGAPR